MQEITSRICITKTTDGFQVKRENNSVQEAAEILQRVLNMLRTESKSVVYFEIADGESEKICIAFNIITFELQISVSGLASLSAATLVNTVAAYFNAISLGLIQE
jgi:hypothetical protein